MKRKLYGERMREYRVNGKATEMFRSNTHPSLFTSVLNICNKEFNEQYNLCESTHYSKLSLLLNRQGSKNVKQVSLVRGVPTWRTELAAPNIASDRFTNLSEATLEEVNPDCYQKVPSLFLPQR
jgi:hypothetical protein